MSNFEKFEYKLRSRRHTPQITIGKGGRMYFNAGCCAKYNLTGCQYATLYFNKERNQIGIKVTEEPQKGGFRCAYYNSNQISLTIRTFFIYYGLTSLLNKLRYFEPVYDKETNMFIIDLKKELKNE